MTLGTIATVISLLGTLIGIIKVLATQGKKISVLMKAQQAQMRNQMLVQYHFYIDRGYITDDEMDDWENQYQAYHCLGANGVLDKRRDELMHLPSKKDGIN